MRRSVGFFSVLTALSMFVLGTGCSSDVTEPPQSVSPLLAIWLADVWEITDVNDSERHASHWSYPCGNYATCSVFWLSTTQDSFRTGTTKPAGTSLAGSYGVTPRGLNAGSLTLHGNRATLTGVYPPDRDDRLPTVWEAILVGDLLTIEGTGTWDSWIGVPREESHPGPAKFVVRLRRCPDEWLLGSHGRGGWCNPYKSS